MEQKMIDKIDKAHTLLEEKIDKFDKEVSQFFNESFLNKDILQMVSVIDDANYWGYNYKMEKGYFGIFPNYPNGMPRIVLKKHESRNSEIIAHFTVYNSYHKEYTEKYIERLKYMATLLNKEYVYFEEVKEKAKDIIEDITNQYKAITEKQSETLDSVFEMLDVDEEPTKHIKVTVEWI